MHSPIVARLVAAFVILGGLVAMIGPAQPDSSPAPAKQAVVSSR